MTADDSMVRPVEVDRPGPGEELNTGSVTVPRVAASVIVLRDSDAGPEVLLVQRNPAARFMGGAWVFPGGAVHDDDGDPARTATRGGAAGGGRGAGAARRRARGGRRAGAPGGPAAPAGGGSAWVEGRGRE